MSGDQAQLHLDDASLQGLADGSLRGPQGFSARAHCDDCELCAGELSIYEALSSSLSSLTDPPVPLDFTAQVVAAAGQREAQLAGRRQHLFAAIPAAFVAVLAVVGWALSAGLAQRVNEIIDGVALCQTVCDVAVPVWSAARLPIAGGALVACVILFGVLARALRPAPSASEA